MVESKTQKDRMQKTISNIIKVIPFIMIGVTLMCSICSNFNFYSDLFVYLPDILGYSVLTNLVFLYHFSFNKYCNVTRAAVWGLLLMNVVSIATKNTEYYSNLHDIYIGAAIVSIVIIFKVKRW